MAFSAPLMGHGGDIYLQPATLGGTDSGAVLQTAPRRLAMVAAPI